MFNSVVVAAAMSTQRLLQPAAERPPARRCTGRWMAAGHVNRLSNRARREARIALAANSRSPRLGTNRAVGSDGWPQGSRSKATDRRDMIAARSYSITSSARARSVGGTSKPSALAVWALMTISNLVGCWTGRSAGLAPLKILST